MHSNTVKLYNLRNAEYLQFLTDALAILGASQQAATTLDKERAALTAKRDAIDAIFAKDSAAGLTETVAAADERRDSAWTGIRQLASACQHHFDPAFREAASRLRHAMDIYGAADAAAYQAETAAIASFLKDLGDTPALTAAVSTLGLQSWIGELAAANTAFATLYLQRTTEMAANFSSDTIKALRLEANATWYALRDKIAGHCAVNDGAEPWGSLVQQLNTLVGQYTQLLATRQGKANPAA